jgi:membrane protein DedA with SNARE-associated domain
MMFDQFSHVVADASGWAYVVLMAFALLDALIPVVPSEASVITAGVVAADGGLSLPLVIAAAAVGAFLGDNTAYLLGRRLGARAEGRLVSSARGQRLAAWARKQLADRGGELIIIGRFIPGGRTAVALTAGTTGYPWARFAAYDVAAALVWASYAALLGFFGGRAFERAPWKGLILAFGLALSVTAATEVVRSWRRRRRQ